MPLAKWSSEEASGVWPRPLHAKLSTVASSSAAVLIPGSIFLPTHGCCTKLLTAAFDRAEAHIFANSTTRHSRLRVAGLREHGLPPEHERLCGTADTAATTPFGGLRVEVSAPAATALQLGVDESYALHLDTTGSVLTAATEWGALRGIETFTQLVQQARTSTWTSSGHATSNPAAAVLCGLPLAINDAPAYAWRGMLVDSSRHFLPLIEHVLPLIDAMASTKLNVLHWHITDAQSFPFGSEAVPELPQHGAYAPGLTYTLGEMRAVVAYAHARGVRSPMS